MVKTIEYVVQTTGHCDIHDLTPAVERAVQELLLGTWQQIVLIDFDTGPEAAIDGVSVNSLVVIRGQLLQFRVIEDVVLDPQCRVLFLQ